MKIIQLITTILQLIIKILQRSKNMLKIKNLLIKNNDEEIQIQDLTAKDVTQLIITPQSIKELAEEENGRNNQMDTQ